MYPEDVQGRVPLTPMERAQLATERAYHQTRNLVAWIPSHSKESYSRGAKQLEWTGKIDQAVAEHGSWFHERAYWNYAWRGETEWYFCLAKSAEPTIMDVPDPEGDTCYVTERLEPIEHKIEGTDPDAVGQAAVEFIRQIQLPVQNVPMPMEREIHERLHGGIDLLCRCKLSYGIAVRDFLRFSEHGPWLPRRRETQLLGYPMSQ